MARAQPHAVPPPLPTEAAAAGGEELPVTPNFQMLTRPPDLPEESGVCSQPGGRRRRRQRAEGGAKTIAINLSKPDVEMGEAFSRTRRPPRPRGGP